MKTKIYTDAVKPNGASSRNGGVLLVRPRTRCEYSVYNDRVDVDVSEAKGPKRRSGENILHFIVFGCGSRRGTSSGPTGVQCLQCDRFQTNNNLTFKFTI